MPRSLFFLTLLALAAGCGQNEEIRRYAVPKQEEIDRLAGNPRAADASEPAAGTRPGSPGNPGESQRMLAAIVLRPSQAWFFKLVGNQRAVDEHADEFDGFLKSVHFLDESTPDWSLPAGWTRQAGNQFRFATLAIDAASLEVSVTTLPRGDIDETEYVLGNINRWRGQLGLEPIAAEELPRESKQVEIKDGAATLVDLVGQGSGGMSQPFARRSEAQPEARPPAADSLRLEAIEPEAANPVELKYEVPNGWQEEPASGFRKASFKIREGDQTGDVSVSDLAASAGDLLPNVNRWRGQVGLEPTTESDLEKHVEAIDIGARQGKYIEMIGDEKATLGAIVKAGNRAWFIKLTGDKKLVERHRDHFKNFARSLRIGEKQGAK